MPGRCGQAKDAREFADRCGDICTGSARYGRWIWTYQTRLPGRGRFLGREIDKDPQKKKTKRQRAVRSVVRGTVAAGRVSS